MNKKAMVVIVIAGTLILALGVFAAIKVTSRAEKSASGAKDGGTPTGDVVVIEGGRVVEKPNPSNTVVLPPDVQAPGGEPIFLPKNEIPVQQLPQGGNDTVAIKTTGGIRQSQASNPIVICGPSPSPEYWVEMENGKLGDRTFRMNFTIAGYQGPGKYTTVVGIAMSYPDGSMAPSADGQALVEVTSDGAAGNVRGEFQFTEGLVSVSLAYRCGAPAPQ